MRRNVFLFLFSAILLCGIFSLSSCSNNNETMKLSELGDEALIQYLDDEGISIPNGIVILSVREMLADLEADPNRHPIVVSWAEVSDFFEELRVIVKRHCDVTP